MSFAAGMVVDNSIVVLENIYRHRELGESRTQAAYNGAREVWGAVLASTLTTMAVFIPVTFVQEEAGQLFRDIAIAVSAAVGISLVVSITLIPTLSAKILRVASQNGKAKRSRFSLSAFYKPFTLIKDGIIGLSSIVLGRRAREIGVFVVLIGFSALTVYFLMPKAEYLPEGDRNMVLGILIPPTRI
jgi:HAE1 family hydrophobic/amphiphilic exporter-1